MSRFAIGLLAWVLAACTSTHYIDKDDLLRQAAEKGDSVFVQGRWAGNRFLGMEVLDCRNKKGERVRIGLDHNTQLLLFDKEGRKTQMYFNTVACDATRIFGYRSNIVLNRRQIRISEVDSIEIYSEFKSERPAEEGP